MPKRKEETRIFNGKVYALVMSYSLKKDAEKYAKNKRKKGNHVRVIKGKNWYYIYTRPKVW